MQKAMDAVGTALRAEQKTKQEASAARDAANYWALAFPSYEIVGAGPSRIATFFVWHVRFGRDSRIHPTGSIDGAMGTKTRAKATSDLAQIMHGASASRR